MRLLILSLALALCTCDRARDLNQARPPVESLVGKPEKHVWPKDKPIRTILDSDTANEIDDLFAIAYALPETRIELLGLSSAQWFHALSGDSTVYQSQRLNEDLLRITGRLDLPHPLGADMIMGKPWGGYEPRDSPAARFIIEQAKATPAGEKLAVLSIGAVTNLASAIAIDPTIKGKIVAYTLGFRYDFAGQFWNKDEFNIRRDLNAANFLLNAEGLELHVMPISVAIKYAWGREATFEHLARGGELGAYLQARWEAQSSISERERIMWDVALLQAFLRPDQAEEILVQTPPENTRRSIWMYQDIDEVAMEVDFWNRIAPE